MEVKKPIRKRAAETVKRIAAAAKSIFISKDAQLAGEIVPKVNLSQLLTGATRNIGGRLGLFTETAQNSDDAGATEIRITLEGRGDDYTYTILDNGRGMGSKGRQSFLDTARSYKDNPEQARGRHGLGVKRMIAEFRFVEVVDISAAEKDDRMRVMAFDWDDFLLRVDGDLSKRFLVYEISREAERLGLKKGATGVYLRLTGRRDRYYSPEEVVKHLSTHLAPWVAEKVTVNGAPLAKREIVGKILSFTEEHDKLGRIRVQLYIPRHKTDDDILRVGTMGPVCEWREFCALMSDPQYASVPKELSNPLVSGLIDVSAFNKFCDASRRSFDQSLAESALMDEFINCLTFDLAPKVGRLLGELEAEAASQIDERLQRDLTETFRPIAGEAAAELFLNVKPRSVELLSGETTEFTVRRMSDNISRVLWDEGKSGGTVRPKEGLRVKYTAGPKVGEYAVIAYSADDSRICDEVSVSIVPRRELHISPARVTLELGESVIFTALNWADDTSGEENLRWETNEPGASFSKSRGPEVTYRSGYTEGGPFEVAVFDRLNRRKRATAYVTKVQEKLSRPHGEKGGGGKNDITLEGMRYRIIPKRMPTHQLLSYVVGDPGRPGTTVEIYINTGHPVCVATERDGGYAAKFQLALREVILRHIAFYHREEELSSEQVANRVGELHLEIIKKLEEAS